MAPFMLMSLLALPLVALPPAPTSRGALVGAAVLTVVLVLAGVALPWRRLPAWTHPAIPLTYFVVVALLRHAQGGAASGYAPLSMLPIIWLALIGTRRQLAVGVVCVAFVFAGPLVLGDARYPLSEWRHAILWTVTAGLLGFWVQSLVAEVRRRGRVARESSEQLAFAEQQLALARMHSPLGIATTTAEGTFLDANPALCAFLGRDQDDLLGHRAGEFSHPDDLHGTKEALGRLARGEIESHREEKRYVRPDGDIVWARLTIARLRTGDTGQTRLLCHFDDITQRRRVEESLRESEEVLRSMAAVARELNTSGDVRRSLCESAVAVAAADAASIFEPDGHGALVMTAAQGMGILPERIVIGAEPSGAVAAFLAGERIFVEDAQSSPVASRRLAHATGMRAVLFEPIVHRGVVTGVILVAWHRRLEELAERQTTAVALLASEAAVALEHEDMLMRLRDQSRVDELTGLHNRRAWETDLPAKLAEAVRDEAPICIAMIDLDHFKRYNDLNGHQAGDTLLREAAGRWRAALRPGDLVARYGGEEFAVVLPACNLEGARVVLGRLLAGLPDQQTCSIGVAEWTRSESAEAIVARADSALYAAKQNGRNRLEVADGRLTLVSAQAG